jgi:hypothetical protein
MEDVQALRNAYIQGYKDGWQSVSGSGSDPPVFGYVNSRFLIEGKSHYESGYQRGRIVAQEKPRA